MKILIACEYSGIIRDAFIRHGYDAVSCDILPTESPGPHIQGDVKPLLNRGWDLIIAHPPCTYLCNSGVRWLHCQPGRWELMLEALDFFNLIWAADAPRIAIENPIPHKYALGRMARPYIQVVHPYLFGDLESKATCLWIKGLPGLKATDIRRDFNYSTHKCSPSKDRSKKRSRSFPGMADAMASQWGILLET